MQRKPFLIIGGSPNVPHVDKLHDWVLDNGAEVIGLNMAALRHNVGWLMDYWLVWDTHDMHNLPDMLWQYINLTHLTYVFRETEEGLRRYRKRHQKHTLHWFKDGEMTCAYTSATAACQFAAMKGASEIHLAGVDLCTPSEGWDDERFQTALPIVNEFFTGFGKKYRVPVYKTLERSPLALPYRRLV